MARFDVYQDRSREFFVNVRADEFDDVPRLILVPLHPAARVSGVIPTINPVVEFRTNDYVVLTQYLASVPKREFSQPIGTLVQHADEITRALDVLFTGF